MTAIKPERLGADRTVPEKTGPEAYAPTRKSAERSESEQAAVTAFEGEIREFVRRDVAYLRRQRNDVGGSGGNILLVLKQQTSPRTNPECPKGVPIGDCPGLSGAWYRVVFESYDCTPDALRALGK